MNSSEIVSALRAGAPGAAEKLYDSYAEGLYQFCWFMLRNRETAKVALRDAIVLGEAHIARLSDPEMLKPWLYALARAECQRRQSPSANETDEPIARPDQQDADLRLMAWNSVMSLDPAERTAIDLVTRHGMEPPDAALVMGMPLLGTQELLAAARNGLEQALVAEILVHRGSHECPGRTDAMRGWAGTVTPRVRERLLRHAGSCPGCLSALPRNVSAARVFSLLPAPALPRAMRARVLSCFSDPELSGYRTFAAGRLTAFDAAGFPAAGPVPDMPDDGREAGAVAASGRGRKILAGFGAAAAAVAAAAAFAFGGLSGNTALNGDTGGVSAGVGHPDRATGTEPSLQPGAMPTAVGRIGLSAPVVPASAAGHRQAVAGQGQPVPATSGSSQVIVLPPPGVPWSPSPGPTIPPQPSPGRTGHLQVSPASLSLGTGSQGQIVLTANGGTVSWAASTSSADVTLSDASGQLSAGQSVTIVVTVSRQAGASGGATVYINPGSTSVPVSWDASPSPSPSPSTTTAAASAPPRWRRPAPSPSPSPSLSSSPSPAPSPAPSGPSGSPSPSPSAP